MTEQALTVTVGVPCYNAAAFVEPVCRSLLAQTEKPERIIVVDDGSTDDTATLAEAIDGVEVLRHDGNKGLAAARNTLIEACTTDILVMIDSDAPADRRLIAEVRSGYTEDAIAGVGGRAIEVHRQRAADRWRGTHQFAQHWGDDDQHDVWFLYGLVCSYRVRALREVGGFDLAHSTNGEDVEMGARLRKAGYRLVYNPRAWVFHQRQDDTRSLLRMVYRYCKGGLRGLIRNQQAGLGFGIVTGLRHLKRNIIQDARHLPDPRPLGLSIAAFFAEMAGYLAAARDAQR